MAERSTRARRTSRAASKPQRGRDPDWLPRRAIALVFLAGVVTVAVLWHWPLWLAAVYPVLSTVTFGIYWRDKRAAQREQQRTPENTLQLLALFGGWPGALLAQGVLRHKNRKVPFQIGFWVVVAVNLAVLSWLTTHR